MLYLENALINKPEMEFIKQNFLNTNLSLKDVMRMFILYVNILT